MSFSDTFAFVHPPLGLLWGVFVKSYWEKNNGLRGIVDIIDTLLPLKRRWKLKLDMVNKSQKYKPRWLWEGD
jgi:hypothetical protein